MLKNIIIAAENFCVHQIREEHSLSDSLPKTKTLIAYIDIEANDSKKYTQKLENFSKRLLSII